MSSKRRIRISVCLPVSLDIVVRNEGDGSEEWDIDSIEKVVCNPTVRDVEECLDEATAKSIPDLAMRASLVRG